MCKKGTVTLPTIKLEYHGEHHQGAETVEMILPFELDGSSRLFSTNGQIAKSK